MRWRRAEQRREKLERAAQDANAEIDSRVRAFEENLNDDDISSDQ